MLQYGTSSKGDCMSIRRAEAAAQKALEIAWDEKFPIDPIAIARKISVQAQEQRYAIQMIGVSNEDLNGASGSAEFSATDGYICKFNKDEYGARSRFTQAHELGHVILNHVNEETTLLRDDRFINSDARETEANAFAAELLMPKKHMPTLLKRASSVSSLAQELGVSVSALSYRLKNLGLL
ncbi:ImmA/IrrE family metallo-endopeptidase [Aliidiomarina sanyensis]|nr:ImmA/IrrE family metallo-endopeptidase [Aliidiomarina sanyensis]